MLKGDMYQGLILELGILFRLLLWDEVRQGFRSTLR